MRVLVTGGAGFIGSHIVDRLIDEGHSVLVVDDLSTGSTRNLNPRAKYYYLDIQDEELERILQKEQPDAVCHHAAQIDVRKSLIDPVHDTLINVAGSVNLLECCRRSSVGKVVFASSGGAIYGSPEYLPISEGHTIRPIVPYGLAKSVVEQYIALYERLYEIDGICLRYGNVYGPRQDIGGEAGVVAIFVGKLLDGDQASIFGDGRQQRDYIYVDDVVDANMAALVKDIPGGAYNIGSGIGTSVTDLYGQIARAIQGNQPPEYRPARPGELDKIWLNSDRAAAVMGWSAKTPLADGLRMTVDSWRSALAMVG